jgi:citrate synthase
MATDDVIKTRLWSEIPAREDDFVAEKCLAAGYDVYGDLLGKVSWIEYLYLLSLHKAPTPPQKKLLNDLAVAIACLGPRDPAIQAAMTAAAAGATAASSLIAAIAVGAGQLNGARDVHDLMLIWAEAGNSLDAWRESILQKDGSQTIWPDRSHPPGFDPTAGVCGAPLIKTIAHLDHGPDTVHLQWLHKHRVELQDAAGMPLAFTAIAAAAFLDLGLDAQQGEMLFLLLRLPGAATLAVEQHQRGWKDYPFHKNKLILTNDPGRP